STYARRFQSTLPSRGVTPLPSLPTPPAIVSIHTPLAGSDGHPSSDSPPPPTFQSTLPSRGVTRHGLCEHAVDVFQSTLPSRGVTNLVQFGGVIPFVSIHTPLAGSDISMPWCR